LQAFVLNKVLTRDFLIAHTCSKHLWKHCFIGLLFKSFSRFTRSSGYNNLYSHRKVCTDDSNRKFLEILRYQQRKKLTLDKQV